VLEGREIRPLHGQFRLDSSQLIFRDFLGSKTLKIDSAENLIGSWKVKALGPQSEEESIANRLQSDFQNFIQNYSGPSLSQPELKKKFLHHKIINSNVPKIADDWIQQMQNEVALESPVEHLLGDESISDVLINSWDQIFIERAGKLSKTGYRFTSSDSYDIYIQNLLAKHNCQHSPRRAFHNFQTSQGVRVHVIGAPLTSGEFFVSFRRFPNQNWSLQEFIDRQFLTEAEAQNLRQSIWNKDSIVISGSTGTGKTSLLKALLLEVPASDRLIVLEDTPEIQLNRKNTLYLRCREDSIESSEGVGLKQLLKESLRMRPDRIILGEVRGEEAFYLLMAMNTGHRGSISSLHANSPREALWRLQSLIQLHKNALSEQAVRELCAHNIKLLVHLEKTNSKRRIAKIQKLVGLEGQNFLLEDFHA
jgi:pilus assembly protein CpaF